MMSVKHAAELWGLTPRRVSKLCGSGRISGAIKNGARWLIPADTEKPVDQRVKHGTYKKGGSARLPLPVGISDFRKASGEYYYVDKTLMIKDFIDERPMVSLFTRPRRFGKTLNMDMLRTFFEKTDEDTSVYFRDKKIWSCGESYRQYQGKFPVIFLTFKDVKFETWADTLDKIKSVLRYEYGRHKELADSPKCSDFEKKYYSKIIDGTVSHVELTLALSSLSQMLDEHYGIAPIIIIDEYDTPIQQGHMRNYYDEIILFMRNLFSGGLKDNRHLSYGFMTGILRVAKESIFSGLNNLKINSILDNRYSEYFGFTPDEVRKMAAYYHVPDKYDEICKWYDGYRFGDTGIFNPWSVISYFNNECFPQAFWQSTGSNKIIGEILADATPDIFQRLEALMRGDSFFTHIDTGVIYPQIRNNPSSVYSFLLVAGYLKIVKRDLQFSGDYMCEVALPNKEISFVYSKEILEKYESIIPQSSAIAIQEAIYSRNLPMLQNSLQRLLIQSVSYNDATSESFYHGLVLGFCAMLDNRYYVSSNRESGEGKFDIQLMPHDTKLPGILIELKSDKNCTEQQLENLAKTVLQQIDDRKYDTDMKAHGVESIIKYGVAFCGKAVRIAVK